MVFFGKNGGALGPPLSHVNNVTGAAPLFPKNVIIVHGGAWSALESFPAVGENGKNVFADLGGNIGENSGTFGISIQKVPNRWETIGKHWFLRPRRKHVECSPKATIGIFLRSQGKWGEFKHLSDRHQKILWIIKTLINP